MNEWADRTVGKLKQRQESNRLRDAKFIEQQRIKKARGPALWNEVRNKLKENCEALNLSAGQALLTFKVTNNSEVRVFSNIDGEQRDLTVAFNENDGTLVWSMGDGPNQGGHWEMSVTQSGGVEFLWDGRIPNQPNSIATQILDAVLGLTL